MITWTEKTAAVSTLKPFERNPRKISKDSYARLKSSIEEMGYHQRCIAQPDGTLIGGHQRLRVFKELGITEIQILTPDRPLTETEYRRLLIQDNIAFGEFDVPMLAADFTVPELEAWGVDAGILNRWPDGGTEGQTDPDALPEPGGPPISVLGDVWALGGHRIMCGSATDADNVLALLAGAQPMLMVTDPPYGVNYDAGWRDGHDLNIGKKIGHKGTGRSLGKVGNDDRADWREAWALFPGDCVYVWHGGLHSATVADSLAAVGFEMRAQIIWAKQHFVFSRGNYHWQHDPCWYAVRKGKKAGYSGDRKQTTLWEINNNNPFGTSGEAEEKLGHSTQKPVECMRRPIENNSKPGDGVYEPFSGSGTTIIAAEMTGRKCFAMEINPEYVDMAVRRLEAFTGLKAVHAKTEKEFGDGGKRKRKVA